MLQEKMETSLHAVLESILHEPTVGDGSVRGVLASDGSGLCLGVVGSGLASSVSGTVSSLASRASLLDRFLKTTKQLSVNVALSEKVADDVVVQVEGASGSSILIRHEPSLHEGDNAVTLAIFTSPSSLK